MRQTAKLSVKQFDCTVRAALKPLANDNRAAAMRAYMRDRFAYLGVGAPERRAAVMPLLRAFKPPGTKELREAVEVLWARAEREYQYVAADLVASYQSVLSLDDLSWLLDLAQRKSWWDSVDTLVKPVGGIVRLSGAKGARAMNRAVKHENFWVRRIAMLHQLGLREATDTERLFRYAEFLASEGEFFVRKAVGWALRDYAWHDWRAVERFLETTPVQFSALTVREASKNFARLKNAR